jgi:hypothetical protein
MDMQSGNRDPSIEPETRTEGLERERLEALRRSVPDPLMDDRTDHPGMTGAVGMDRDSDVTGDPDMTGVPVEPVEPTAAPPADPRIGAAVVGGALGAVAGALVGGPAGAVVSKPPPAGRPE